MDFGAVIRFVVVVAVIIGLAQLGRATHSQRGPAPQPPPLPTVPGAARRRGFAREHPWTLLLIVVATLFVVTVGPYVMFIGGMWLACRGGPC